MESQTYRKINISILVVEDSLTQAEEIRYFLEESGYNVDVCHDGKEAFEWLLSAKKLPDIIVSDIVMPHLDGYELCKKIRADEKLKNIPVILLTSLSEPHDIIKSIEAGANKFLTKPFDHKRLPEVIDELYINTQRRCVDNMEMGIRLMFGGNDFLITANKIQILDLLLSSYEDSYYKNLQLQESRSALERLNAELEQKVQERTRELKIQEENYRTLSEHTPDLIVRVDKNLNFVYLNRAVETLFGIPRELLIGQPTSKLDEVMIDCACSDDVGEVFKTQKEMRKEMKIQTSEGIKWLDSAFVPEYNESGELEYVLEVSRDITQQKKVEEQLKEKDKMMMIQSRQAAMGDMIAMIAHQWRQPLSIMAMENNNLKVSIGFEEEITADMLLKHVEIIDTQVQHLSQTIDDFRNFFQPHQDKESVTTAEMIEKSMKLMRKSLENKNIEVVVENRSERELLIFSNLLLQVFINLINNAKDIINEKKIPNAKIVIKCYDTEKSTVINICDNGGGIPKNIMDRVGEPYFTTKKANGTGLGIYMSKTIVTEHLDGELKWENKEEGVCFTITLKIAPEIQQSEQGELR
ncbi:MAG: response regulator [Sulfurimonas sp.]|nr:response regulator [Sulfurimonas sp.]